MDRHTTFLWLENLHIWIVNQWLLITIPLVSVSYHIQMVIDVEEEKLSTLIFFSPNIPVPGAPELTLTSATSDSVSFSWAVPGGTVVESYDMMWNIEGPQRTTRDTASSTIESYTVGGLDVYDNTTIGITVTSVNVAGTNTSGALTVHSDFLQCGPEESKNEVFNVGVIIGGAVGVFLIGIVTGTVIIIVVFKLTRKCRK